MKLRRLPYQDVNLISSELQYVDLWCFYAVKVASIIEVPDKFIIPWEMLK